MGELESNVSSTPALNRFVYCVHEFDSSMSARWSPSAPPDMQASIRMSFYTFCSFCNFCSFYFFCVLGDTALKRLSLLPREMV